MKSAAKSDARGLRAAAARALADGRSVGTFASQPGAPLKLSREESDSTVARIARTLRKRSPSLDEDPSKPGASYLASSFVAYAAEKHPQSMTEWSAVLLDVLGDAGMRLDDEDDEDAALGVVKELSSLGVLVVAKQAVEEGMVVLALLAEDDEWHEAVVEESLGACKFRVLFLEYGKPQLTDSVSIRTMDMVVDDDDTEEHLQRGDCEMCGRHLLLTFHHLIPKDTHPAYLNKRLPRGLEGEPTRGFLNTYGTMVCKYCHSVIHGLANNVILARDYNTLPKILEHPRVQRWVEYAKKQRNGKKAE